MSHDQANEGFARAVARGDAAFRPVPKPAHLAAVVLRGLGEQGRRDARQMHQRVPPPTPCTCGWGNSEGWCNC